MTRRQISKSVLNNVVSQACDQDHFGDHVYLCIDSRMVMPGDIFLAIRGDLNDGHRFIDEAVRKGCALVIADEGHLLNETIDSPIIYVPNTLDLLGAFAQAHMASLKLTSIAITGSNGKTTTKEMLKAAIIALVGTEKVYATAGNKNNLFGLPLCVLDLTAEHRFAIFELGMNHVGEMKRLCAIVDPDVAVITNISEAHAGNFVDGIAGVSREKSVVFDCIAANNGTAVINTGDPHIFAAAQQRNFSRTVSFGIEDNVDVSMVSTTNFSQATGYQRLTLAVDQQEIVEVDVPLAGRHHAMNATCVIAIIKALDLPLKQAAVGIRSMEKITGRMTVSEHNGITIINDGYNANPVSMRSGIIASQEFAASRRIAALGAMLELGEKSREYHEELGHIVANNFDYAFICNEAALPVVVGAEQAGMTSDRITYRDRSLDLIEPLKLLLKPGDLLFIKGSFSSEMQAVALALLS